MKFNKEIRYALAVLALLPVNACSNAKETLGLTRQMPDEFAVLKRAPLELPPDYNLRPPRPGAPRPQEMQTVDEARTAVLGDKESASKPQGLSNGAAAILTQAGAGAADPNIRQKVDRETTALRKENEPVVRRIFGFGGDDPDEKEILNPNAEQQRIQKKTQKTAPAPNAAKR